MSTRCQVLVTGGENSDGELGGDAVTLYHHCDGYPTAMLPLFVEGFEKAGKGWQTNRAGHAAAFLISVQPDQFEPESGHELHGDIKWYYVLRVGTSPWQVEVYQPRTGGTPGSKAGKLIAGPLSCAAAVEQAEKIENGDREDK